MVCIRLHRPSRSCSGGCSDCGSFLRFVVDGGWLKKGFAVMAAVGVSKDGRRKQTIRLAVRRPYVGHADCIAAAGRHAGASRDAGEN